MKTYRVGFPFWKQVARAGATVSLRIEVMWDKEAGVFVARSPDLRGLVVEAPNLDELVKEAYGAADMLLTEQLHEPPRHTPVAYLTLPGAHCAA